MQDDSEDEDEGVENPLKRKKRWRSRNDPPKRQWVLQEETEYLETMIARQEQGKSWKLDATKLSSRYEGVSEHNQSQYVVLSAGGVATAASDGPTGSNGTGKVDTVHVTLLPTPFGVQTFHQPSKVQTMSMTEAEQAIEDKRANLTRYMMHRRPAEGVPSDGGSKGRLLGRLRAVTKRAAQVDGGAEDEDDVMGDVKFESRKGSNSGARKELLSSLGDGVAVDADGVMGGGNDSMFGGKRRFTRLSTGQAPPEKRAKTEDGAGAGGAGPAQSNDGLAMADDFYQRDVKAEYDELDYDVNDQFDDDDVDLGEADINVEGGFADDLDNDDDEDGEDDEEEADGAKEGFASIKGLKDMLAKAKGETPTTEKESAENADKKDDKSGSRPQSPTIADSPGSKGDSKASADGVGNSPSVGGADTSNLAQVMAAAQRSRQKKDKPAIGALNAKPQGVQVDEHGQRILSLEAVRYEIFLHNKSIQTKKLMKIFSIKKKSAKERIKSFQAIIKELCIIKKDPVQGNLLVLKQHYAK